MSPVIACSDDDGREKGISAAVDAVRAGHLVVLPTDTVYGVGADAFDEQAVAALLAAKGRGREMPPPVLVPSPRTIDGLAVDVADYARRLIDRFWPGALTIVVRAQASLMWDLGDTNGTVAVRMPDQPLTLAVLAETGPLAVTSANRHGEPPARTVTEAASQLGPSVTVYLDAGPSGDSEASTIVDCTGDAPVILRHGAIPESEILAVSHDDHDDHDADTDAPAQTGGSHPEDTDAPARTGGSRPDGTDAPARTGGSNGEDTDAPAQTGGLNGDDADARARTGGSNRDSHSDSED